MPFYFVLIQFQVPQVAFLEKSVLMSFETVFHCCWIWQSESHQLSLPPVADPPQLVHSALPHFRCWADAKRNRVPSEPPKWCIERGFVTRLSVKMFLPEAIFGTYKGELLCLWKSGLNFPQCRHLVVLSIGGFVQIARVKAYTQLVGFDDDRHTRDPRRSQKPSLASTRVNFFACESWVPTFPTVGIW